MPELTVAQAHALDARFGWLWYLGATRKVTNREGVRWTGNAAHYSSRPRRRS